MTSMTSTTSAVFQSLNNNIYCIDALYTGPDIACCYLLVDGDECALIETGTALSVDNILATLRTLSIPKEQLRYIVPTHVHLDHAGGAGALMQQLPQATLLIHPKGARHIIDPTRLIASAQLVYGKELFVQLHGEVVPVDAHRVQTIEDGETLMVGQRRLRVKHTRGHADHHFCLFDEQSKGWFSGDMFGVSYARQRFAKSAYVMPATTPTQFDPTLYQNSVQTLCESDPAVFYLTHFGALTFQKSQQECLLRQLEQYASLGSRFAGDIPALETAVLDVTRAELRHLLPASRIEVETSALTLDAKLNAQGIAWWSQQQTSLANA
ncbi:MBL fold metallo-hydrolase [Congregibacter brevis]|uniref:MBL fold metallo-hydrolase n=1 Tax=Congregibacter brevis TaxID=3081201 RepID=A0ABZ0ICH5_9GAMM|nr:MBL fold metallo-hydrolase [Congregibacter sp. IMCC45268]